ncbi:MAG: adenine phosphoribosyltransferase [Mycobacteriales bacterium]
MSARRVGPLDLDALLRSQVIDVPGFPQPGVVFKDISPLLADHVAFAGAVDAIVAHHGRGTVDKVVGIEARGVILAAPVAYHFGAGFVPVRKPGKLPLATHQEEYDLEYGSNVLQVHQDAFAAGDRVLIVDDVLATGGTAAAAARLVRTAGAELVGLSVLLELEFLSGRAAFSAEQPDVDVHALLTY